jgi:hypothetical protein
MKITRRILTIGALAALLAPLAPATVLAATSGAPASSAANPGTNTTSTAGNPSSGTNRLDTIKSRGDAEIGRRLDTLNRLLVNISDASKLTDADKLALNQQVSNEATKLMQLRLKLAGETQVGDAINDISAMLTEYRVYALISPKVKLIKAADDQQIVEQKLSSLQAKLDTRISNAQASGKDVSALQSKLKDMETNLAAAQALSSGVETSVLPLQPTDYDKDHTILSGYKDKLQTAKADVQNAYADAKSIVAALKNMK